MKQFFKPFQFLIAAICMQLMLIQPILVTPARAFSLSASADKKTLNEYCADALTSSPQHSGQTLITDCQKAQQAVTAESGDDEKAVVYGIAFAVTTALAFTEVMSAGTTSTVCEAVGAAAAIDGVIEDASTSSKLSEDLTLDAGAVYGIMKAIPSLSNTLAGANSAEFTTQYSAVQAQNAATTGKQRSSCLLTAAAMGLEEGLTIASKSADAKAAQTSLAQVKTDSIGTPSGIVITAGTGNDTPNNKINAPNNKVASSTGASDSTSSPTAETSALTSSPLGTAIQQATGQNLGDMVAAGTAAGGSNPVAAALGATGDDAAAIGKLMDTTPQLLADAGLSDYHPVGYIAAGGGASKASGGFDFGSLMASTLKSLNPSAKAGKEDASDLVFRQLDLLPPNKIEANKDISLFARIGYRYRKNSSNVVSLNWSNPANQTMASTAPAAQTMVARAPAQAAPTATATSSQSSSLSSGH